MNDDDFDELPPVQPTGGAADLGDALGTVETVTSTVGAVKPAGYVPGAGTAFVPDEELPGQGCGS